MEKYNVVCGWTASYDNPITLKKDEKVIVDLSIKETDPEWADWVWCMAGNGTVGWVPIQILNVRETLPDEKQIAIALEDYSAYELTVDQGDTVVGDSKCLNGWLWCRKENSIEEGWLPMRCLQRFI